jgi:hypothetical protein
VESDPTKQVESTRGTPPRRGLSRKWIVATILAALLVGAAGAYVIMSHNSAKNKDSTAEKVLTVDDLDGSDIHLNPDTSDASVDNLTKQLKANIDKQIAAKENPIDTVEELADILSNTVNSTRQDQLIVFMEDFLANHEDSLWFTYNYDTPSQAQVNYWKAELYAYMVYYYRNLMNNKFTDSDGKLVDTSAEQLKYIDLYIALANDPASHPAIPEEDSYYMAGYQYKEIDTFTALENEMKGTGSTNE